MNQLPRPELPVLNFGVAPGGLHVELENLLGSNLLVAANTRGGKSWVLRALLEQTHGRVQQLVIDPEGQLHTLRERFAYVLAAVEGGDVPVTLSTARELPRRLMELGTDAVIDVSDLEKDDRDEYLRLFFVELIHTPRALWHQVLVAIDEIHLLCPEQGFDESVAKRAVIDLASRGLKRGFSLVGATQRVAKFSKSASSDFSNRLLGRTVETIDRERMGKDLGLPRKEWDSFKWLRPGEFFASGAAFSPGEVVLARSGPVLTTHPKAGQVAPRPAPTPSELKDVLAGLANLAQEAEQAEQKAKTVEELEQQVRELKEQLRTPRPAPAAATAPPSEAPIREVPVPVITEADHRAIRGVGEAIRQRFDSVSEQLHLLATHVVDLERGVVFLGATVGPPMAATSPGARSAGPRGLHAAPPQNELPLGAGAGVQVAQAGKLGKWPRAMLAAVASVGRLPGPGYVSRQHLGVLVGLTWEDRAFGSAVALLKRKMYVLENAGGELAVTAQGLGALGEPPAVPPSTGELLNLWAPRLKLGARAMLSMLVAWRPRRGLTRGELVAGAPEFGPGEPLGPKNARNCIGALKSSGLAVERDGRLVASDALFLGAAAEVARAG